MIGYHLPRRLLVLLTGALLIGALLSGLAFAEEPAPLVLTANSALGWGSVVATGSTGTVTVSPEGGRTAAGGVALASSAGVSAVSLTVTGEPNLTFSIVLPSSATLGSGGSSMTVDSFTCAPSGSGSLGPAGSAEIRVGATLHVGSAQSQTSYSGSFDVTVAYN